MPSRDSDITVTDMFCGAGGSSTGAAKAGARITLAMNHWELALETHNTNHPNTTHVLADIRTTDPRRYPSTRVLLSSPECTNHTNSKGKKRLPYMQDLFGNLILDPAAERSRSTMWDVVRFTEYHRYDIVIVENVVEAAKWELYEEWLAAMRKLGYQHHTVFFNAMFALPTPQSRDRMYVVFWRKNIRAPKLEFTPHAYCPKCETHIGAIQSWKRPLRWGRYKRQYLYRCPRCTTEVTPYHYAAFNAIDWSIPAERIGDRKRPLKEKTLKRVRYGLEKYGRQPLVITTRYAADINCRAKSALGEALPTQPGGSSHAILSPWLIDTGYSHADETRARAGTEAGYAQTTRQTLAVATPPFLFPVNRTAEQHRSIDNPYPTQTGSLNVALVAPGFLSKQYSGDQHHAVPLNDPTGAITTWDHHALVGTPLVVSVNDFDPRAIPAATEPAGTQTTQDKWALAVPPALIAELHGAAGAGQGEEALACAPASNIPPALIETCAFLSYYYGSTQASGIGQPVGTVTSVDRAALVQAAESIQVEDCTFRMLKPHEIGRAMNFPLDYVVLGDSKEQVKQYGNAVVPAVMEMLVERCMEVLWGDKEAFL